MAKAGTKTTKASGLSKMDAVRQAISKLGNDAMPTEIRVFVKKTYDIDMTLAHVSNYKSTVLKGAAGKSGATRASGKSGFMAKPRAAATGPANGKDVTKMEGVRQALGTLGNDAKPLTIQEFVKKTHGLNIPTSMISSYKSGLLKKGAGQSALTKRSAARASGGLNLDDIRTVKELTGKLGADKVGELAALFG